MVRMISACAIRIAEGVLVLISLVTTAVAQVTFPGPDGTVFPSAPIALEQIWIKLACNDLERCAGGTVSMAGNTVTVVRYTSSCLICSYPLTAYIELGRLPAGAYTVRVVDKSGVVRSTQPLTVTNPNPSGPYVLPSLEFPLGNYTDQWWDPEEPGWGIAVTQHVSGSLFAIWAVYGADNKPTWYTLQPGRWTAYNTYSGPVYRTSGPYFGGNYASGPPVIESLAGSATLTFSDPASGILQFNVDSVTLAKPIIRLQF
jgi:hypothetical protein